MTPSPEGWPTKAKEAPSPHEVKLAPLDTNPVFQRLKLKMINVLFLWYENLLDSFKQSTSDACL